MTPARKEIFDRVAAFVGLVLAIPVMVLIALVIKLRHPSLPLLFVETVVGKDAVPFRFYKFRTMLPHPIDYDDRPEILPGNPLVTRVGGWLRRFKLDELPQLFHVLLGQMSIVGPRPMDVRRYERASEFFRQRALVKPGLTGLAQVSGNIYLTWEERMEMDVWYIEQWSMALDLEIIVRTAGVILQGEQIVDKLATTRRITDHSHRIRVRRPAPVGQR